MSFGILTKEVRRSKNAILLGGVSIGVSITCVQQPPISIKGEVLVRIGGGPIYG
jgi:hypothetical protein